MDDTWQRITLVDRPRLVVDVADAPAAITAPCAPACPDCGGIGYYKEAVPYGHPHFGVLFPCHCKMREQEQRAHAELLRMSNLGTFREKTFERFNPDVPGVGAAYNCAVAFARQLHGWLVLLGTYGAGKTHLAAAIVNDLLQRHFRVLFTIVPDLLDHLRATFGPASDVAYDARFDLIRSVPVLVLDDLGTENTTPWAREKLFQLINHRSNEALPTVITSNRKLDDLDPRIASRLADRALGSCVTLTAADYRRRPI